MSYKKIKNKIGYCDNRYLPGVTSKKTRGHYVFIRKVYNNDTCDVSTVVSLEDKPFVYKPNKIKNVRAGYIYSIPHKDANFTKWSGVNMNIIKGVKTSKIVDVGKKYVKRKHLFNINKFVK